MVEAMGEDIYKHIYMVMCGVAVRELDINQVPSEEEWMVTMEDEDDSSNGGGPPRKKLRLTKEQSRLLEHAFTQNHTLNPVIILPISLSSPYHVLIE